MSESEDLRDTSNMPQSSDLAIISNETNSQDETNLTNTTESPKPSGFEGPLDAIMPDFIAPDDTYDFPLCLSENEEWVNYRNNGNSKDKIIVCEPFAIMELNRLVPYLEDNCVKFHPLNMPYIKIGKIEIMGFVTRVNEDARFYEYQVDDGTGTITIYHQKKYYNEDVMQRKEIDQRYERYAAEIKNKSLQHQGEYPKHFPKPRPKFTYPPDTELRDMAILETNWSIETDNGLLGKKVERLDYVHAVGYCTLDFMCGNRPREEITYQDLCSAKLNFLATKVSCMKEEDYNRKFVSWIYTVIDKRYDGHPGIPDIIFEGVEEIEIQEEEVTSSYNSASLQP